MAQYGYQQFSPFGHIFGGSVPGTTMPDAFRDLSQGELYGAQTRAADAQTPWTSVLGKQKADYGEAYNQFRGGLMNAISGMLPGMMGGSSSLSSYLGAMGVGAGGAGGYGTASHYAGGGPAINSGPVWSGQQIQDRVNQSRAGLSADMQNSLRGLKNQFSTQGFSTNRSPLLMQMEQMGRAAGSMNANKSENDLRWTSAQGNAQQQLAGQTAAADSYWKGVSSDLENQRQRMADDAARRQAALGAYSQGQNQNMGLLQYMLQSLNG